jgi:ABC-type branched-subunit amino acid transport system ATPase component
LNYMIQLVMALVVGGMFWPSGALIGGLVAVLLPQELSSFADYDALVYAAVLLAVLRFMPTGIVGSLIGLWRVGRRRIGGAWPTSASVAAAPAAAMTAPAVESVTSAAGGVPQEGNRPVRLTDDSSRRADGELTVTGVSVRFGGLDVLSDVNLSVERGAVRGLIGPNGAGKTTLFNVISGFVVPREGQVTIDGARIDRLTTEARAARGIARTFQAVHVFEELTVVANVMAGMHTSLHPRMLPSALRTPATGRAEKTAQADARELLDWVGIGHLADRSPKGLPFGSLKLVEIARALATRPQFLLLDEPCGGLHGSEIELLERIISMVREAGIGILLVEHNVPFVMRVCDRILVLDHGVAIADGTSADVMASAAVAEAYLGRTVKSSLCWRWRT